MSESPVSSNTIVKSDASSNDFSLIQLIQDQLETNRTQVYQLQFFRLTAGKLTRIYFAVVCILASSLIAVIVLLAGPTRNNLPQTIRELAPAGCVFLVFGLYQAVSALMKASTTKTELEFLLSSQGRAIARAESIVSSFEPEMLEKSV
ncbi:MAG: hypothetical protein ACREEM_32395 [Blastocatellia bacterium]